MNSQDFSQRLQEIINYYELSGAALAEKIGVQRSSISHLLSGRNKPSLDFILKLIENFSEVDLYWLLKGEGSFPAAKKTVDAVENKFEHQAIKNNNKQKQSPNSEIDKIIIFYKDGRFDSYKN